MPLIHIELYKGRSDEKKRLVATGIARLVQEHFGSSPAHTHIVFNEVERPNWLIGQDILGDDIPGDEAAGPKAGSHV